jgi:hypothetical protein
MKGKKIRRIALAAALASTTLASAPHYALAQQTASDLLASLSTQVEANNFAASRATIAEMQRLGIGSITVGSETITLTDLLAMIDAAEQGTMDPAALASYLDALAASTAAAVFVPSPSVSDEVTGDGVDRDLFPVGSEG